jgi:hypothetical protein
MASADVEDLVKDVFAHRGGDLHRKPYTASDREAEAAKIARLRHLRLARDAASGPKKTACLVATR